VSGPYLSKPKVEGKPRKTRAMVMLSWKGGSPSLAHAVEVGSARSLCGKWLSDRTDGWAVTDKPVSCQECIKKLAAREAA
jgi:hypothetical protein